MLIQLHQVHPGIEDLMQLVEGFLQMLSTLQGHQLEDCMQRVQQNHLREMQNSVEKLRQDQAAVQEGLTLSWNNEAMEG